MKHIFKAYFRKLFRLFKEERGQALPLVLAFLALGAITITPFLVHVSENVTSSQIYSQLMNDAYSTDAGVEQAIWNLTYSSLAAQIPNQGDFTTYPLLNQINGLNPSITVTNGGSSGGTITNYHIQSSAGSKIIVASVNIANNKATVLSWNFATTS